MVVSFSIGVLFLTIIHQTVNKSPESNSGILPPGIRTEGRSRRDLLGDERLQRRNFNVIYNLCTDQIISAVNYLLVPLPLIPQPEPDRPVMNDVIVIRTRGRGRIEVGPVADDYRVV